VERDVEQRVDVVNMEDAGQRFTAALARGQAASPATVERESEWVRRFREALERAREQAPAPAGEQESEAIRRFREVLEQTRLRATGSLPSTNSTDAPGQTHEERGETAGFIMVMWVTRRRRPPD
jgi:hypothetical protein